jgi:mycoredoxin
MVACAVVVGAVVSIPLGVVFLVAAVVFSPLMFPRPVTDVEARERGRPIIYWRPGCQYCLRLRIRLGVSGRRFTWVDIWRDPAGAATVRGVTGGNETVPTVVVGGVGHVNPDPRWVRALVP